MAKNKIYISIRSLIIWAVMAITVLSLTLTGWVALHHQLSRDQTTLVNELGVFSDLIGAGAVSTLLANDRDAQELALLALKSTDFIENAHIYKVTEEQGLEFFARYNKPGIAPVKPNYDQIEPLVEPRQLEDVIEIARPIHFDGEILGYVYLRATTEMLEQLGSRTIITFLSLLSLLILFCLFLTLKLQRSIASPIEKLVALIKDISRHKNYASRAQPSGIKELDILGKAINSMLERTQNHIQRQADAEDEYKQLNISLEEKVHHRTLSLKDANSELIHTLEKLHQFQRQMVENEKMASLGDMVAGVAHEVNTPIGLGVTASTMMLDRLGEMKTQFEEKTLKASTLSKFILEGQENLKIIYRNLNRAAELISSFKQVAVDQTSENYRIFSFTTLMGEILISMRPILKKLSHQINVNCPDDFYIESKAGPISQIMINLINNSIIHGFEDMDNGIIDIQVDVLEDTMLSITFKDNGKGIPDELGKRIFDPFVTTKRGQGGSGLGMHLVYNLVTQGLNGSISLVTEEGQGVAFKIIFPVKKVMAHHAPGNSLR